MSNLVRIKRRIYGKDFLYRSEGISLRVGDHCIVDVERGIDYGKVVTLKPATETKDLKRSSSKVIRLMTEADHRTVEENRLAASRAFITCQDKVNQKGIPMKLVVAEYSFDRSRLLFYFTAEGRIDFRELVKELAAVFKTRIELRQIGVRDESRIRGGLGICGRQLCCCSFIRKFDPVNLRMARNQRQSLDPEKISGLCGRLFCCLCYEDEFYRAAGRRFPREGEQVTTPRGTGRVIEMNFITESVVVELEEDSRQEFLLAEIKKSRP